MDEEVVTHTLLHVSVMIKNLQPMLVEDLEDMYLHNKHEINPTKYKDYSPSDAP